MPRSIPYLVVGGVAGAITRWAVGELLTSTAATLLTVNTVGSFVLGAALVQGQGQTGVRPLSDLGSVRLGVTVGFCGGLTTFSGLAVDLMSRWRGDEAGAAGSLALASVVTGLVAIVAGQYTGRRMAMAAS